MSRINGDKARSAIQRRRRIAQRMKDRARRAQGGPVAAPAKPAPKAAKKATPAE
jgi:hypothetical protein